jgi:hypothetical protein
VVRAVDRNDARFVDHLVIEHHIVGREKDLVVAIRSGAGIAADARQPVGEAALDGVQIFGAPGYASRSSGGAAGLRGLGERRDAAVGRIGNE